MQLASSARHIIQSLPVFPFSAYHFELNQILTAMDSDLHFSHHYRPKIPVSASMDGEFGMYKTLDGFPLQHKALARLRRCAFIVAPIMQRHGWSMPMLSELHPFDSCLGKSYFTRRTHYDKIRKEVTLIPQKMHLRLRASEDPATILPTKEIMRTVLHELAHFDHRSHFFSFYRCNAMLLAELDYDVEEGCIRRKVSKSEVPSQIASRREIRNTMIRDVGKKVALCLRL